VHSEISKLVLLDPPGGETLDGVRVRQHRDICWKGSKTHCGLWIAVEIRDTRWRKRGHHLGRDTETPSGLVISARAGSGSTLPSRLQGGTPVRSMYPSVGDIGDSAVAVQGNIAGKRTA
jgi:hypothetical protein